MNDMILSYEDKVLSFCFVVWEVGGFDFDDGKFGKINKDVFKIAYAYIYIYVYVRA